MLMRLRNFALAGFIYVIGAFGASAIERSVVVELIRAGDVADFESRMLDLHKQHVAGEILASDLREPFGTFSLSDPAIASFLSDWIAAFPDSPYAHAAASWYFYGIAWRLRGEELYRYTWPEAMDGFYQHLHQAEAHGRYAFELTPDLLPASDLLLVVEQATNTLGVKGVLDVVATTMQATPNRGTLYRAVRSFHPNWGGRPGDIAKLCDLYWDKVPSTDYASPMVCAADLTLTLDHDQDARRRAIATLNSTGWDGFEWHQWKYYSSWRTRRLVDVTAHDFVDELEANDATKVTHVAKYYSELYGARNLDMPFELRPRLSALLVKAKAHARAWLDWDPGSPDLVRVIATGHFNDTTPELAVDFEEVFGLWGGVLQARPFNSDLWLEAAQTATKAMPLADAFKVISGMHTNAVAYANHSPEALYGVLSQRARMLEPILGGHFVLQPDGTKVKMEQDVVPEFFVCETIRLSRLRDAVCEANPRGWGCTPNAGADAHVINKLRRQAVARGTCLQERKGEIEEIVMYPVSVQVGSYRHDADTTGLVLATD